MSYNGGSAYAGNSGYSNGDSLMSGNTESFRTLPPCFRWALPLPSMRRNCNL